MWLRDLLPRGVPNARIMVYGYNSNQVSDASTSRIQEHARAFAQSLLDLRRDGVVRISNCLMLIQRYELPISPSTCSQSAV